MRRWIVAGLMVLASASCSVAQDKPSIEFTSDDNEARLAVVVFRSFFLDPDAVRFEWVGHPYRTGNGKVLGFGPGELLRPGTVCGFFNARNIYGAYVGFSRFGFDTETSTYVVFGAGGTTSDPLLTTLIALPTLASEADHPDVWRAVRDACSSYMERVPARD